MPDRKDWKSTPLLHVADGSWLALEHLVIESIRISGTEIKFEPSVALLAGQRLVISNPQTNVGPVVMRLEEEAGP